MPAVGREVRAHPRSPMLRDRASRGWPTDLGDGEEMRPSGWRAGCPSPSGSGESRRAAGSRRPYAIAGDAV